MTNRLVLLALLPATLLVVFQQQPRFEATVARVRVDVIITDSEGRFVDDLVADDFVLLEDGEPQRILSAELVDLGAGNVITLAAATGPDVSAGATFPAARAASDTLAPVNPASNLGAMIFLIDGSSLGAGVRVQFAEAWAALLDRTAELRVPRAVFLVDNVGRVEELVPLTYDVEPLRRAAEIVGTTATYGPTIRERLIELTMEMEMELPGIEQKVRAYEFEERSRSLNTLEMLTRFCHALMSRPGRTALVWVSTGLKLTSGGPFAALLAARAAAERNQELFTPSMLGDLDVSVDEETLELDPYADVNFVYFTPDSEILRRQEELHEAANSANVSIYAIDPTPQSEVRAIGFSVETRTPNSAQILESMDVQGSLDELRDSMREAAQSTGGEAMIHWSDTALALERIEEDTSRFYLLTYSPPPPLGDGDYHDIKVEVRRPGLDIRERTGYVDLGPAERSTRAVAAALAVPGTVTANPMGAKAFRMWSSEGKPIIELVVTMEDSEMSARRNDTRTPKQLHAVALTPDGELVDEIHLDVQAPPHPPAAPGLPVPRPFVHVYDWELNPGEYDLRVAVHDEASGQLSATRLDVLAPEPDSHWQTGDVMLTVTDGGRPAQPLVDNAMRVGERLDVYIEVFGGEQPSLSGDVFSGDGAVLLARFPRTYLVRDAAGIYRGAVWLDGVPGGEYVLQMSVLDLPAGEQRGFRIPLKVTGVDLQ